MNLLDHVDAMDDFTHQPLANGQNCRFVILKPQTEPSSDAIHCQIVHGSLDNCSVYEALSYTWGTNVQDESVIVLPHSSDGLQQPQRLGVTKNLFQALRRLRQGSERRLWIDQLCINQIDDAEKLSQVHVMWKIYQRAARTILWLGEEDPISLCGMELCAKMVSLEVSEECTFNLSQLSPFLELPWFSRLWVIQEVAFSRRPVAMLGFNALPWSAITTICSYIPDEYLNSSSDSPYKKILWMNELRDLVQAGRRPDLIDLLARGRGFGCSLPADRIRAMHGLISHGTQGEAIGRDGKYAEFRRLFMALVSMLVELAVDGNWPATLDSITHAGTRNSNLWPSWPSWVPDWTNERACQRPYHAYFRVTRRKFDAAAGIPMGDADRRKSWYQRKMLLVEGKRVDTVYQVYEMFEQEAGLMMKVLLLWQLRAAQSGRCQVNEHFQHDFGRTIAADFFLEEVPEMKTEFYALYWRCVEIVLMENVSVEPAWLQTSVHQLALSFYTKVLHACKGQRFFVTETGLLGLGPPETEPGDSVVVLYGAEAPFIIRPQPEDYLSEEDGKTYLYQGGYILIGDCYIDGIMYGEAARRKNLTTSEFLIL